MTEEVSDDDCVIVFSPAFPEHQTIWACTANDRLLKSVDGGHTWTALEPPFAGQQVTSLILSPGYASDRTILVSSVAHAERDWTLRLWRSTDDGRRWSQVWERTSATPQVVLAVPGNDPSPREPHDQVFIAAGNEIFCPTAGGSDDWTARDLPEDTAQVLSLAVVGDTSGHRTILAGTSRGVFVSQDNGQNWQQPSGGPDKQPIVTLTPSPNYAVDRLVWVLAAGGDLWQFIDFE